MVDSCLIQTLAFPTTLQITSVLLNTCFIPNSASSCRKHQLVDECFFKKKFYPHHPPKTSVSRFTTHPPTFARKHQIEGHNKMHKKQRQTSSKSKACGYLFSWVENPRICPGDERRREGRFPGEGNFGPLCNGKINPVSSKNNWVNICTPTHCVLHTYKVLWNSVPGLKEMHLQNNRTDGVTEWHINWMTDGSNTF